MPRRLSPPEPVLLERQEQIDSLCAQCRSDGRFTFDTEFVMEDRYQSEVCLIQMATRDATAIIDPFSKLDLRPVWELVCDERVETVVHSGQEDLALCVQHTGRVPRHVFDVQIAAGLAGYEYPMSLQRLVQATLHIRLHKSKTLTDWRKRPLTPAQFRYAAEDVCYLLPTREKILERLEPLGRAAWAEEEFARFEDLTTYRRADAEKVLRIKGAGSLKGQQLAVLNELFSWRDGIAQRVNRPARIVLKDHLLIEIARQGMTEFSEIRDLRGVNLSDRDVHALCRMVEQALTIPPTDWPADRPQDIEPPRESALLALSTAVIRSYCLEHELAYGLVATQRSIRELIRHRSRDAAMPGDDGVELLRGWRGATVGAMLDDVLAGRRTVCVEPVEGELAVHVGGGASAGQMAG